MPSIVDKLKVKTDQRIRFTEEMKQEVTRLHKQGIGIREIARIVPVSRRSIQFYLFPERLQTNLQRRAERGGWAEYYDREKHKEYMSKHRKHKREEYGLR